MAKNGGGKPDGPLGDEINKTFKDFATFQQQFKQAAILRFGSGWAWLVLAENKLLITSTANQDSPLLKNQFPVLGIDIWSMLTIPQISE